MTFQQWVDLMLQLAGIIAIGYSLYVLSERYFGDDATKAEPKPKPRPRDFRVVIEDPDGWSYGTFSLSSQEAARVMREIKRINNGQ